MPNTETYSPQVFINWGHSDWSTLHTDYDVTDDVISYQVRYGASIDRGSDWPVLRPAEGTLILQNHSGRYGATDDLRIGTAFQRRSVIAIGTSLTGVKYWDDRFLIRSIPPHELDVEDIDRVGPDEVKTTLWSGKCYIEAVEHDTITLRLESAQAALYREVIDVGSLSFLHLGELYGDLVEGGAPNRKWSSTETLSIGFIKEDSLPREAVLDKMARVFGAYAMDGFTGGLVQFDVGRGKLFWGNIQVTEGISTGDDPIFFAVDIRYAIGMIHNSVSAQLGDVESSLSTITHSIDGFDLEPDTTTTIYVKDTRSDVIRSIAHTTLDSDDISGTSYSSSKATVTVTRQYPRTWKIDIAYTAGGATARNCSFDFTLGGSTNSILGRTYETKDASSIQHYDEQSIIMPAGWYDRRKTDAIDTWLSEFQSAKHLIQFSLPVVQPVGDRTYWSRTVTHTEMAHAIQPGWTLDLSLSSDPKNRFVGTVVVLECELSQQHGGLAYKRITAVSTPAETAATSVGAADFTLGTATLGTSTLT